MQTSIRFVVVVTAESGAAHGAIRAARIEFDDFPRDSAIKRFQRPGNVLMLRLCFIAASHVLREVTKSNLTKQQRLKMFTYVSAV